MNVFALVVSGALTLVLLLYGLQIAWRDYRCARRGHRWEHTDEGMRCRRCRRLAGKDESMVKFTASGNGITLVGLGLEDENVRRMQAGSPVRVKFADLGFVGALGSVHVVIFTGKDADTMRQQLAGLIGPETLVLEERSKETA